MWKNIYKREEKECIQVKEKAWRTESATLLDISRGKYIFHPNINQELTNKWQWWVDIARLVQKVVLKPWSTYLIAALQNNFWASSNTRHPSEEAIRIGQLQMVEARVPMTHDRNYGTVGSRMKARVGYLKMYSTTYNCYDAGGIVICIDGTFHLTTRK